MSNDNALMTVNNMLSSDIVLNDREGCCDGFISDNFNKLWEVTYKEIFDFLSGEDNKVPTYNYMKSVVGNKGCDIIKEYNEREYGVECKYPISRNTAEAIKANKAIATNKAIVMLLPFTNSKVFKSLTNDELQRLMSLINDEEFNNVSGKEEALIDSFSLYRYVSGLQLIVYLLCTISITGLDIVIKYYNLYLRARLSKTYNNGYRSLENNYRVNNVSYYRLLDRVLAYMHYRLADLNWMHSAIVDTQYMENKNVQDVYLLRLSSIHDIFRAYMKGLDKYNNVNIAMLSFHYQMICSEIPEYRLHSDLSSAIGSILMNPHKYEISDRMYQRNNMSRNGIYVESLFKKQVRLKAILDALKSINRFTEDGNTLIVKIDELELFNKSIDFDTSLNNKELIREEDSTKSTIQRDGFGSNYKFWSGATTFKKNIISSIFPSIKVIGKCGKRLSRLTNMTDIISIDLSELDMSDCTDISGLFEGSGIVNVVLPKDCHNVINTSHCFKGCRSLQTVDLGGLNLDTMFEMSYMFKDCSKLSNIAISGKLKPYSNCREMFSGCKSLSTIDIYEQDAYGCRVDNMFVGVKEDVVPYWYNNLLLSKDNIVEGDSEWISVDVKDLMQGKDLYKSIKKLKVTLEGNVPGTVNSLCANCMCEEVDLSDVDLSKYTNFSNMFSGCTNLTNVIWPDVNVYPKTVMGMFYQCTSLEKVDLSKFNFRRCKDFESMFQGCSKLSSIGVNVIDITTAANASYILKDSSLRAQLGLREVSYDGDMFLELSGWNIDIPKLMDSGKRTYYTKSDGGIRVLRRYLMGLIHYAAYVDSSSNRSKDAEERRKLNYMIWGSYKVFQNVVYYMLSSVFDKKPTSTSIFDLALNMIDNGVPTNKEKNDKDMNVKMISRIEHTSRKRGIYFTKVEGLNFSAETIIELSNQLIYAIQSTQGNGYQGYNGDGANMYIRGITKAPGKMDDRPRQVHGAKLVLNVFFQLLYTSRDLYASPNSNKNMKKVNSKEMYFLFQSPSSKEMSYVNELTLEYTSKL